MDTKHSSKSYSISRNYIINNFFASFYQIFEKSLNLPINFDLWQKPHKESCTLSTMVEISGSDACNDELIVVILASIEESLTEFIICCSKGLDLESLSNWIFKVDTRFNETVAIDNILYTPITATELLESVEILEKVLKKIAGVDGVAFTSSFGVVCLKKDSIDYKQFLDMVVPPQPLFYPSLRIRVLIQVNEGTKTWRLKSAEIGSFWASLKSCDFLYEFQSGERGAIDPKAVLQVDLKVIVWKSGCTVYKTEYSVQKVYDQVLLTDQEEEQDLL